MNKVIRRGECATVPFVMRNQYLTSGVRCASDQFMAHRDPLAHPEDAIHHALLEAGT
jgi:hypothetical protein